MQGTGHVNVHDLHNRSHLLIRHSKQTISMNTKWGHKLAQGLVKNWFPHFSEETNRSHVFVFNINQIGFQWQISLKTFVAQPSFSDMGVNGKTCLGT